MQLPSIECKRRKVRCSLVDSPEAVRSGCERRGTKSQASAYQLEGSSGRSAEAPTVSQELYASLPSRENLGIICKLQVHVPISFHTFITKAYPEIEKDSLRGNISLGMPTPESHPVLLAKYMLRVAMIRQSLDVKKSGKQLVGLSDAPQLITKRLAEAAIRLVTTHDELLGTEEGIECVMMETSYQANCGNFRPAWMAVRKAMTLAQIMGIHRPGHGSLRFLDPRHRIDTSFLWYRIVYLDRFMCLMMGLPQGSMDRTMTTGALAGDTPLIRLERAHCIISSRILERNDVGPLSYSIETTREIDFELQNAADMMPNGWWVAPELAAHGDTNNPQHPLHIPFMLRFSRANAKQLHDYSETACVNAYREILSRYIALRSSNQVSYTCRVLDFFTLSSAFLLLVAHRQHARTPGSLSFIAHQRHGDRALVGQAVQNLQDVAWISQVRTIAHFADVLLRLLDIEAEAAKGRIYSTYSISSAEQGTENGPSPSTNRLRFCIPSFGFVRIVPDGSISKEVAGSGPAAGDQSEPGTLQLLSSTGHPDSTSHLGVLSQAENGPGVTVSQPPWYAYPGSTMADDWTLQRLDITFFDSLLQGSMMPSDGNALGFSG
ncbi:hypothetical protein BDW62DRAFT_217608 [Aspergillus aurantiobrunneus]